MKESGGRAGRGGVATTAGGGGIDLSMLWLLPLHGVAEAVAGRTMATALLLLEGEAFAMRSANSACTEDSCPARAAVGMLLPKGESCAILATNGVLGLARTGVWRATILDVSEPGKRP